MRCMVCGDNTRCESPFCSYHLEEQYKDGFLDLKNYDIYKNFFRLAEELQEKCLACKNPKKNPNYFGQGCSYLNRYKECEGERGSGVDES